MAAGLPPLLALAGALLLIASRVPGGFAAVFSPAEFARRDALQYLSIAIHGYQMGFHCHHGPHTALAHVHVCGNVTWFAGYPLLIRVATFTGLRAPAWLIPYAGGGRIAIYRAEALLIVLVPLLRRLPAWALVIPVAATIWVAAAMAPAFFANWLV
jgi:hypothetical protein